MTYILCTKQTKPHLDLPSEDILTIIGAEITKTLFIYFLLIIIFVFFIIIMLSMFDE